MTICIAGKNEIAVKGLQYLMTRFPEHTYMACCNKTDDGVNGWQPSYKKFCQEAGVQVVALTELYAIEDLVFISLEFDQLVRPEKFVTTRLYNIHFSKLPAYKGMFTSVFPLLNGETESGVTLHCIDKGIDTGDIIAQQAFPLDLTTTAEELYVLYLQNGLELFYCEAASLLGGNFTAVPQPTIGSSYYSKSSLNFQQVTIDLAKTAFEVHNQIRAFVFRTYQLPTVFEQPIYKSEIIEHKKTGRPGTIAAQDEYKLLVNTIDYQVMLYIDKEEDLKRAAAAGDIAFFKTVQQHQYPIDMKTREGWDALIIACYHNQHELAAWLLAQGFNPNATNYRGTTAAMYAMTAASRDGNLATLQLLSGKVNWAKQDDRGRSIFSYAEEYNHPEVLKYLKQHI